jgi:hypothetical protein
MSGSFLARRSAERESGQVAIMRRSREVGALFREPRARGI